MTSAETGTASATGTEDPMLTAILAACEGTPDMMITDAMAQAQTGMGAAGGADATTTAQ